MFCIRAGIDQLVTEEAIESAARYADPSLAECEDGIPTTLEDAPRVTKNLYRYLDIFDLGGSQSVSAGNITEGDGTYTGFFSGMNADNIEVVKHHVNNYIVYQTYEVEVHYKLKFPWKFIFNDERIYIPMIARAEVPVTDSAEFIRNVDMAIDMFERSEGGEDFFANADIIYGKVRDFLNGENADGEAVAGGVKIVPIEKPDNIDTSNFTHGYDVTPKRSTEEERKKRIPAQKASYGTWTGERGNSVFVPNSQEIKDLLPDGVGGITYKNCMPDFSIVAVGEVEIEDMSYTDRDDSAEGNYSKADEKLAEQWGCTKSQIKKWRKDHDYTWHELNDGKTMQLVPTKINATFKHLGGCSECKP